MYCARAFAQDARSCSSRQERLATNHLSLRLRLMSSLARQHDEDAHWWGRVLMNWNTTGENCSNVLSSLHLTSHL